MAYFRDDQRLASVVHPARDPLAVRHPGPADLVADESVRRGEGQVRAVAIEQVERGDVRVEDVAGLVDDRHEELHPRSCGRRQPRDAVTEPERLELAELPPAAFGRAGRIE